MKPDLYLINGPLGAGKTTFLRELLKLPKYNNARVIENEFANTSIDTGLLHDHHAEVQTIAGVCICCSTGDELTDVLSTLSSGDAPVLIEATGVANSLKLIEKIVNADMLDTYTLRHAIFVLDALEATDATQETIETYRHELQAADTVLLSKADLLNDSQVERLMDALSQLKIRQLSFVHEGQADSVLFEVESNMLEYFAQLNEPIDTHEDGSSYTVLTTSHVSLEPTQLQMVWKTLQLKYGLRRMKGAFQSNDRQRWHIEATPHQCRVTPYESGALKVVIIGRDARSVSLETLTGLVSHGRESKRG